MRDAARSAPCYARAMRRIARPWLSRIAALGVALGGAGAITSACSDFSSSGPPAPDAAPPEASTGPADAAPPLWDGACTPGAFCDNFERSAPRGLGWDLDLLAPDGAALMLEIPPWSDAGGLALRASCPSDPAGAAAVLFHSTDLGSRFGMSFKISVDAVPDQLILGPAFLGKDSADDSLGIAVGRSTVLYQADGKREGSVTDLGDITPNTWRRFILEVRRAKGDPSRKGTVFVTVDGTTIQVPLVPPLVPTSSGASAGITAAVNAAGNLRVDDFVFFNEP